MRKLSSHFASFLKKTIALLVGSSVGVALFFGAYSGVPILLALNETEEVVPGSGAGTEIVDDVASPQNALDQKCTEAFLPFVQDEQKKFVEFMNTHLKNAAPNSELLPVAFDELKRYRAALYTKRDSFAPAATQTAQVQETVYCNKLVEDQLGIAESLFEQYISEITYSKQSTALSEKLSGINGKLRNFGTLLSQLDGYFTSFNNKLPSFTPACIKK